jgi:pimeloyl-ACP methyl ester carboxylesterase
LRHETIKERSICPYLNSQCQEVQNEKDIGVAVLEKNLKNYKTVIMKDTGHIPMMESPKRTASHYVSYLKDKKHDK